MEIGVHKNWQNNNIEETQPGGVDPMAEFNKDKESKVSVIKKLPYLNLQRFL